MPEPQRTPEGLGPRPVPWLSAAAPAVHGSFDASSAAEVGLCAADVVDFSANGNVIGLPGGVTAALADVDLAKYPDRGLAELRGALARFHGMSAACVVPGNGSTELIWAIARAFLAPGATTLVVGPTYGEYAAAAGACGARVEMCAAIRPGQVADGDLLARGMREACPGVAWLCHPNNPTGAPFPLDALAGLAVAYPSTLFVVDEAYLPLCEGIASAIPLISGGNVVVLRSMTKDAALAGLRVGYGLAPEPIAEMLRRAMPPWSVSSVAQAAGLAALRDREHAERVRQAVAGSRAHLMAGLERLGFDPYPSAANFVLVPVGNGAQVTRALLQHGFAVRDCTSFGLPTCVRIGVRAISDQERLLGALGDIRDG